MIETRKEAAVVIFSGGQDSTTCLFWAAERYHRLHAITFDYGQRHELEIDAAREVASYFNQVRPNFGLTHEVCVLPEGILLSTSPLVDKGRQVGTYKDVDSLPGGLEDTFVPMRNLLFLVMAANRAVTIRAEDVILGVSQEDFGGYPDCRAVFIDTTATALRAAVDMTIDQLHVVTPLIGKNKQETVELARSIPHALEAMAHTHTCYQGASPPCGKCHACLLRARGFEQAGVPDPILR